MGDLAKQIADTIREEPEPGRTSRCWFKNRIIDGEWDEEDLAAADDLLEGWVKGDISMKRMSVVLGVGPSSVQRCIGKICGLCQSGVARTEWPYG